MKCVHLSHRILYGLPKIMIMKKDIFWDESCNPNVFSGSIDGPLHTGAQREREILPLSYIGLCKKKKQRPYSLFVSLKCKEYWSFLKLFQASLVII